MIINLVMYGTLRCLAQAGALDSSFGVGGIVKVPGLGTATGMAIQTDGKILCNVIGDFSAVRLLPNGAIDSSFGINGVADVDVGGSSDHSHDVALQQDGKILLAGGCVKSGKWCYGLARFNGDGTVDESFGENGTVVTSFNTAGNTEGSYACAVQPDGKIIQVGGAHDNDGNGYFGVVRFNPDGSLDNDFAAGGKTLTAFGNENPFAMGVAVAPNGKIIVGGFAWSAQTAPSCFALVRYNANGSLDNTFGNGGKVTTYFGLGGGTLADYNQDEAYELLLQPDGKIVLAGYSIAVDTNETAFTTDFAIALARYNSNGSLDNTFGTAGKVRYVPDSTTFEVFGAILQPDGKIVVAGRGSLSFPGGPNRSMLARFNPDGTIDAEFGSNGVALLKIDSAYANLYCVAMQADGKILAAGGSGATSELSTTVVRVLSGLNLGVLDLTSPHQPVLIYPNPVHQEGTLEYTLTQDETISIELHDAQGKLVQTLLPPALRSKGAHTETLLFDCHLSSGVYFLRIGDGSFHQAVRIVRP